MEQIFAKRIVEHGKKRRSSIAEAVLAQAGKSKPAWWNTDDTADVDDFAIFDGSEVSAESNDLLSEDGDDLNFSSAAKHAGYRPDTKKKPLKLLHPRLDDITVEDDFRTFIESQLPGLQPKSDCPVKIKPYLISVFPYLAFSVCRKAKGEEYELLAGAQILASLFEQEKAYLSGNFDAEEHLEYINNYIVPIKWLPPDHLAGRCRVITEIYWTPEMAARIDTERQRTTKGRKYFVKDKNVSSRVDGDVRQELRDLANTLDDLAEQDNAQARRARDYLNDLPVRSFDRMTTRFSEAMRYVLWLRDEVDLAKGKREQNILQYVIANPKPYVKPVDKSVRAFPLNISVLMSKREVFQILFQDYTTVDLVSAHVAILAQLLRVQPVLDFLADEKNNLWRELAAWLGVALTPALKEILKHEATYPLLYGRSTYAIVHGVKPAANKKRKPGLTALLKPFGIENGGERFLEHPLMQAMLEARDRELAKIRKEDGATDFFGTWMPLNEEQDDKSILSQMAQSVELWLMLAIFELAYEHEDEFKIVILQHDGCTLSFRNRAKQDYWMPHIKAAVKARADELGIPTCLEVLDVAKLGHLERNRES